MSEQLSAEALAERARRAIQWRLDHYGPRDAEPFQYSRFESEAHAAFDAVLTSEWLAAHVAAEGAEEQERMREAVVVLATAACVCGGVAACFTCQTADAALAQAIGERG